MNVYIGIDPSVNSTGVCVHYTDYKGITPFEDEFYIITPHITKKQDIAQENIPEFQYILYDKYEHNTDDNHLNELYKTLNFIYIIDKLDEIFVNIFKKNPINVWVCIEGISYGSSIRTKSVFDLAGLNYMIRQYIIRRWNDSIQITIATPSEIKKFITGKGNADKDMIKNTFKVLFPKIAELPKYDDIADAYFMAQYAIEEFNKNN